MVFPCALHTCLDILPPPVVSLYLIRLPQFIAVDNSPNQILLSFTVRYHKPIHHWLKRCLNYGIISLLPISICSLILDFKYFSPCLIEHLLPYHAPLHSYTAIGYATFFSKKNNPQVIPFFLYVPSSKQTFFC